MPSIGAISTQSIARRGAIIFCHCVGFCTMLYDAVPWFLRISTDRASGGPLPIAVGILQTVDSS